MDSQYCVSSFGVSQQQQGPALYSLRIWSPLTMPSDIQAPSSTRYC